ncbi:hypothetical protein [Methylobacterium sp. E-066]|uniref:hypothetical protein n=1 Tax=Methylobacterium sp. E-066 TaxID=2836584 RepID=UPI001FBB1A89|nr:hypothetical protein [Methylobacterium sp. E-066]MCJ2139661.1 hypothetical protein [Methylobacterium sp. E-066]
MSNLYCSSVAYAAVAAWAQGTYTVGQIVRPSNPAVGNERCYRCTGPGTTGASEPTWATGKGSATTDSGVTWTEVTGQEAYQAPGAWAAPHARIANMTAWMAAGDVGYCSNDHAETQASAISINTPGGLSAPNYIESVRRDGSSHIPPQGSDYQAGATVSTTGGNNISIATGGSGLISTRGIAFTAGSGTGSASINIGSGGGSQQTLRNFTLTLGGSGGGSITTQNANLARFLDGAVVFTSASHSIGCLGRTKWKNVAFALTGTVPTWLFGSFGYNTAIMDFEACDFSAFVSGKTLFFPQVSAAVATFKDCIVDAGVTKATTGTYPVEAIFVRTAATGVTYTEERYDPFGSQVDETVIVHTGGASDGTTAKSRNITAGVNATWNAPFEALPVATWNAATGAAKTATLEGIYNGAALPTNDQIWIDVEYLGSSASPRGSYASGTKATRIDAGAALPASTEAWDSLAAARANSTTYALGAVIKLASNPGRIFFCTGQGQSAASEPAGYASAVDGGSVTDGGATFRAGVRFKLQASFTAALAGPVTIYPKVGKASATFYVDPKPTVA